MQPSETFGNQTEKIEARSAKLLKNDYNFNARPGNFRSECDKKNTIFIIRF